MNDFYVVSFFTNGYEEDVRRLVASLEKWGLSFCVEQVPDRGSWINNANYKPTFLLEKMRKLKAPIIWIDADGEVVRDPILFSCLNCDVAAHYRDRGGFIELLTGTIFLDYKRSVYNMVQEWAEEAERWAASGVWEQKILQEIVQRRKSQLNFFELPASYCCIFDAEDMHPESGVVMHYQASRRFRRKRLEA